MNFGVAIIMNFGVAMSGLDLSKSQWGRNTHLAH